MANYTTTLTTIPNKADGENQSFNATVTITPKFGYVVSAADFSIDTSSLTNIGSQKANSNSAGAIGNKVVFTIQFSSFTVVAVDTVVSLIIVGDAVLLDATFNTPEQLIASNGSITQISTVPTRDDTVNFAISIDVANQITAFGFNSSISLTSGFNQSTSGGVTTIGGTAINDNSIDKAGGDQYQSIGSLTITPKAQLPDSNSTIVNATLSSVVSSGSATVTSSASGSANVVVGTLVTHLRIPPNTTVVAVAGPSGGTMTYTLSANATAGGTFNLVYTAPIATVFTDPIFPVLTQSKLSHGNTKLNPPYIFTLTDFDVERDVNTVGFGKNKSVTYDISVNTSTPPLKSETQFHKIIISSVSNRRPSATISQTPISKKIQSVDIESTIVDPRGETKIIKVYGDAGAIISNVALVRNGTTIFNHTDDVTLVTSQSKVRGLAFASYSIPISSIADAAGNYDATHSMQLTVTAGTGTTIPVTANVNLVLNQHPNPVLTMNIQHSAGDGSPAVFEVNGSATNSGGTHVYTNALNKKEITARPLKYASRTDHIKDIPSSFTLTYIVKCADGAAQLDQITSGSPAAAKQPTFEPTGTSSATGWSNSNHGSFGRFGNGTFGAGNGGMVLSLTNLSSKLYNANGVEITNFVNGTEARITADVNVIQWGIKDVTMTLDLSGLLTENR
tara:strand:+ start:43 stop:2073 length:2031 start_codon:yes stop_codon:yes gene_type:complete